VASDPQRIAPSERAGFVTLHDLPQPLVSAALAAQSAYERARLSFSRAELEKYVAEGADGTPTMYIDAVVEEAVIESTAKAKINLLSEEVGFIDRGSSLTLVADPVDGSANAAAGVPLACFSGALVSDGQFVSALTVWLDGRRHWGATCDGETVAGAPPGGWRTTGRQEHQGAAVSLLRPHERTWATWTRVAEVASRIRILSCSTLEAALVLQGSTDAFLDAGSDTHRLVDLAAALVLLPLAGGVVQDLYGRPIQFDHDLRKRWSGVVAASPQLADQLCQAANDAANDAANHP
jgi:myo-inositol-1(or 4)-monophosphatase